MIEDESDIETCGRLVMVIEKGNEVDNRLLVVVVVGVEGKGRDAGQARSGVRDRLMMGPVIDLVE